MSEGLEPPFTYPIVPPTATGNTCTSSVQLHVRKDVDEALTKACQREGWMIGAHLVRGTCLGEEKYV